MWRETTPEKLLPRLRGLAALRGVLDSPAGQRFTRLLELLTRDEPTEPVAEACGGLWRELLSGLASNESLLPDAWQSHLVERLLEDENAFSLAAERGPERGPPGESALEQVRLELRVLQSAFSTTRELISLVEDRYPQLSGLWSPLEAEASPASERSEARRKLAHSLAGAYDWGESAGELSRHFAANGAGEFGRRRAFRWVAGGLSPVSEVDPVRLSGLFGYERQREPLVANTRRFVTGRPAHHALLYGLPGTGKSATVKALLNEYAASGLRLVELSREDLGELPRLLERLRGRGMRFVVFVDDLSFEEDEVEYKALKALLEGSTAAPPENVRVYATSNRRNLIKERFSDREEGDDVHLRDSMQEKLSLAARFGLRVTFLSPDRAAYLKIVSGLARERKLDIDEDELARRAAQWEMRNAGRSGRSARQFVDELEAELSDPPAWNDEV